MSYLFLSPSFISEWSLNLTSYVEIAALKSSTSLHVYSKKILNSMEH